MSARTPGSRWTPFPRVALDSGSPVAVPNGPLHAGTSIPCSPYRIPPAEAAIAGHPGPMPRPPWAVRRLEAP